jgi:hypothetical protein
MRDALDEQIDYFEAHLDVIRKKYGSVWAVVAGKKVVRTFAEFPAAADFASQALGGQQVLIRHTNEGVLTAPFVLVEG